MMRISHLIILVAGICSIQVAAQQEIKEVNTVLCNFCLIQCKCDETIRKGAQELSQDFINITTDVQQIDWDNFDFNEARDKLFDLKDKYVIYKKEENSLKKYINKFKRLQVLNETVLETIGASILQQGTCDMQCAVSCIRPKLEFNQILSCMNDNCKCEFVAKIDDFVEHSTETVNRNIEELEAGYQAMEAQASLVSQSVDNNNCNQKCVAQCDFIRQFLDEQNYNFCMEKTCLCTQDEIQFGGSLQLAQEVDYGTVNSNTKQYVVLITLSAFIISLLIGVVAMSKPLQRKIKQLKNSGQNSLSDVKDQLKNSVMQKKDKDQEIKIV
eukprot:403331604